VQELSRQSSGVSSPLEFQLQNKSPRLELTDQSRDQYVATGSVKLTTWVLLMLSVTFVLKLLLQMFCIYHKWYHYSRITRMINWF